jgi:hypothetical protein
MKIVVKFLEVQGNKVHVRVFIDGVAVADPWFIATVGGGELEIDLDEVLRESEYETEVQETRVIISSPDTSSAARSKSKVDNGKKSVGRSTTKSVRKK